MFKTLVIACVIADISQCATYEDTRGPYTSYEACQTRAYAIANQIREIEGPHIQPVRFKCKKLKGEQL